MANVSLAKEHLNEAVNLLSTTTALAVFYTLVFILYCLSLRLSYAQLWDHERKIKRPTAYTLVLATALLMCATLDIIARNRIAQVSYIDNSTLPGGPLGYKAALSIATLQRLDGMVNIIENILVLGVLSWRVWVVWSGTRFVVYPTVVSVSFCLTYAGLMISHYVITWDSGSTYLAVTPQVQVITFIMAEVFCMTSLVFITSTIIGRLIFIRQKHIALMGKSDVAGQYLGIVAMLIESYALDTLWHLGILISFALKYAPTQNFFDTCAIQVDILTNFLLIYRVLSGRAWTRQTQDRLSTLRWASNGAGTTTSGTVDERPTNTIPEEDPPMVSFRGTV